MHAAALGAGLGGALLIAVGFVLQQKAAEQEPPDERLSFRLLVQLVRRPMWLGGIAAMIGGQILGAVALGQGTLALVEPIMATNVLFALPLSAVWHRRRLGVLEWVGAVSLIAGLAAFVAAGNPHGGSATHLPWPNWLIGAGSIALVAAAAVALGRRSSTNREATFLAVAAGVLYGLQDALTARAEAGLSSGIVGMLTSWPPFVLLAVAVVALLLNQSAFEAAPLDASLPATTVAEPLTGIAFGVGVYSEHLTLHGPLLVIELLGVVAMVVGVVLVARSPVVTMGSRAGRCAPAGPDVSGGEAAAPAPTPTPAPAPARSHGRPVRGRGGRRAPGVIRSPDPGRP